MDNSKFVFISYAHKDSAAVLPCVNAMKKSNISLWYDEGIQAGSEWPEFIAEKVEDCTKFVLFISNAYLESQNCKRELNFAISRKKEILSIFLEDVRLSPGVEMQLGTYQAIHKNRFPGEQPFIDSLCREHFFDSCRIGEAQTGTAGTAGAAGGTYGGTGTYTGTQTGTYTQSTPNGTYNTQTGTYTGTQTGAYNPQTGAYNNTQAGTGFGAEAQNKGGNGFDSSLFSNIFGNAAFERGKKPAANAPIKPYPMKKRWIAALLAFFLGGLGIHKFYLKQTAWGVIYLAFCWTHIPAYLSFVEALFIIFCSKKTFIKTYKCRLD